MAFIRRVKTKSGAIAIQIAYKEYGRIKRIIHMGSAHNQQEEKVLIGLAREKLLEDQLALFKPTNNSLKLVLKSSSSTLLYKTLLQAYDMLGFNGLKDQTFSLLTIARIVEPVSKLDSLRVLEELGSRRR
ncbi:hypothetical protein A2774_00550 [Candidatus Roizmanbacteria bacterium RIFCSPHIGHO2_01_FULL_39_12c]|uniref:Uncharacterized protein n=1 Tax=Candidatus Roizmanbacteria bacterium RIFCSPHIGHO2_01_FULL_39_12c TaxID=1802031 RepID=A0A1F7G9Z5_9BACT|nr:MAG: hypothetical protein A2774_00550 [Candidatus Roizmanbacteria bacterium RIFCSPHIGHO2_01_FULL_39_12c]OGK47360.1 MAG: hypothetical protein A2963_04470 [Candidatus Roizmanbacteria bacterium RIFCSPLOWO2_01_FULL_40_13]